MPCSDGVGWNTRVEYVEDGVQTKRLCAIATVLQARGSLSIILDNVDWKEAGTSRRGFDEWWARHQREDADRRAREKKERDAKREKERVLATLTPEQKRVLGLK